MNTTIPKTIFDKDEDVIEYLYKMTKCIIPEPKEPTRVLLIRSANCHPCYRLAFGRYTAIHSIYQSIQEKQYIDKNTEILLYDTYFHSNPILNFWQENRIMKNVVAFGFDDSEGEEWDEMCREKYPRIQEMFEDSPEEMIEVYERFEGDRPTGYNKFYLDLDNYIPSTVSLISNCLGTSLTCDVPDTLEQRYLCKTILNHINDNYEKVIKRSVLDPIFDTRLIYK